MGVELWARRGGGMFFKPGLKMLEEQTGERVLNDIAGLVTFETHPSARVASMDAKATRGASFEAFRATFSTFAQSERTLSESERVAIDFFNASFFEPAADTRLITLVMAVEALLQLGPRSQEAVTLVDEFVSAVKVSTLPESEKASLQGAARELRKESISAAGRRMARERLGAKTYRQLPAETHQLCGVIVPRVETDRKVVALTFDDGPTDFAADGILKALGKTRATFFLTGFGIHEAPSIAPRLIATGHEIGNHTWHHDRLLLKWPSYVANEIESTDRLIRAAGLAGRDPFSRAVLQEARRTPLVSLATQSR